MIELSTYKKFYFIGIGGIGMSALAKYFHAKGFAVAGYDRTETEITKALQHIGIEVNFSDNVEAIPQLFSDAQETVIIYTPAVPAHHKQLRYFWQSDFKVIKRSEMLASVTQNKKTIAVAGTHGKTSTSTLISHILYTANVPFTAFLGGISSNYKTNYIEIEGNKPQIAVVEADEYDRSFHRLFPDSSVITAIEADHLDIYGTFEELEKAYYQFATNIKPGGTVIAHRKIAKVELKDADWKTYDTEVGANFYAKNIRIENGSYVFDAVLDELQINNLILGVPGRHNVENTVAAIAATLPYLPDTEILYKALSIYKGVKRRFEFVYKNENTIFIDDYAHHPTEIEATLETVKKLFPHKKITAIFQPHLFSRTKDLAKGFAESFAMANQVYLLPIYPAREEPIPGVTSAIIAEHSTLKNISLVTTDQLLEEIKNNKFEVLLTIGAGDIDRLVEPIAAILKTKKLQTA